VGGLGLSRLLESTGAVPDLHGRRPGKQAAGAAGSGARACSERPRGERGERVDRVWVNRISIGKSTGHGEDGRAGYVLSKTNRYFHSAVAVFVNTGKSKKTWFFCIRSGFYALPPHGRRNRLRPVRFYLQSRSGFLTDDGFLKYHRRTKPGTIRFF
jgi:hypothetical protein